MTRLEQRRFVRNHIALIKNEIFFDHFKIIPASWGPVQLRLFVHKCFETGNINELTREQILEYNALIEEHEQDLR